MNAPTRSPAAISSQSALHDAAHLARLRERLQRYARQQLRDEAAAEDAVQETLLALVTRGHQFRGEAAFSTYAVSVLRNKIVDHLRDAGRFVALAPQIDGMDADDALDSLALHTNSTATHEPLPEESYASKQLASTLQRALATLPAKVRQTIVLREWLELDTEEISRRLGLSPANVWVIAHRAKKQLRDALAGMGVAAPA